MEKGLDIPENLDDLVIPEEPKGIASEEHGEEVKTDSVADGRIYRNRRIRYIRGV